MSGFKKIGDDPKVLNFLKDIQSLQARNDAAPDDENECPDCERLGCDGYGYIVKDGTVTNCPHFLERKSESLLKKSNIPVRYKNKSLDNYKDDTDERRASLRQVRRFIAEFDASEERPGLFLNGAAGTGKTHLAVGAIRELGKKGLSCLFYNAVSLIEDLRGMAGGEIFEADRERLKRMMEVDVLVLDDLGAGKLSEFVLEKTYSIIDKRYSNNKCLIVTSNKGMNDLEKQISYPVFSRVRGMCFTVMTGDLDFRNPDLNDLKRA